MYGMYIHDSVCVCVCVCVCVQIHIAPWKMNAYREISAVTDCLTTDGESTQIHACTYRVRTYTVHVLPQQ